VRDAYDAIIRLGGAKPGDKTMLDALLPFAQALSNAVSQGRPLPQAWAAAAEESERAAQATAGLRPQVGRARPLAERSVGTPDAGAISLALCMRTVGDVLARD
jgi:dihydroxyacetone kinase